MDGFVQQLGLELVEQPPAERLRVAPGGGPPAERRSVIQSRLDKAARRTEKEVGAASPQPQPPNPNPSRSRSPSRSANSKP